MKKNLGQHWMTSTAALAAITQALHIQPNDRIIEIGPGKGALTKKLLAAGATVVAIEKDSTLIPELTEKFTGTKLTLVEGDVLKKFKIVLKNHHLSQNNYKLVGNIPYYITGKILRLLTELDQPPERAVLTMQKEVALRLSAKVPHMNLLAAIVQYATTPHIIKNLKPSAFSPPPKVSSSIVLFTNIHPHTETTQTYFSFIQKAFAHPRKLLVNNLSKVYPKKAVQAALKKLSLKDTARGQELSVGQLVELSQILTTR